MAPETLIASGLLVYNIALGPFQNDWIVLPLWKVSFLEQVFKRSKSTTFILTLVETSFNAGVFKYAGCLWDTITDFDDRIKMKDKVYNKANRWRNGYICIIGGSIMKEHQ
ncbi:predicted protein [Lichtheimia corymbifera JMRC:FSU:9682]|uniref:Uncharacterized protein n=1 Tax=Lichtheimia corymbifera JMRC:FSU:9682 TaxID=1263082 RepID=A0A068SBW5_9FUNG|nr:predicted protein [Lichtheimia corymbifera JMRC:FSU:9682]